MKTENNVAYKEWACVVDALGQGRYILSLRKAGIHEKQVEFDVEHREFFLLPNQTHQRAEDLEAAMLPLLETSSRTPLPEETIPVQYYAIVEDAIYLEKLDLVLALEGLHPFSRAGVEMRFNYRTPGIWAVIQRVYLLPECVNTPNHRLYAGCRTWVHLKETIATKGALPLIPEQSFASQLAAIRARIA